MPEKSKKTGPKPDHLKIEGDWESAMGKAIKKKKPKDGWPRQDDNEEEESDKTE